MPGTIKQEAQYVKAQFGGWPWDASLRWSSSPVHLARGPGATTKRKQALWTRDTAGLSLPCQPHQGRQHCVVLGSGTVHAERQYHTT